MPPTLEAAGDSGKKTLARLNRASGCLAKIGLFFKEVKQIVTMPDHQMLLTSGLRTTSGKSGATCVQIWRRTLWI